MIHQTLIILLISFYSTSEDAIRHFVDIIEKKWNIKSIYCTYDITIQNIEENKYTTKTIEIAYDGTNVHFFSVENDTEKQKEVEQDISSPPTNLLEFLTKKLYYEEEKQKYNNMVEASLYQGRFLNCIGMYYPVTKERVLASCNEDTNDRDKINTILAPWISRLSLLHLLGISFIPISKGETYYGLLDIPAEPQYLYKPLISVLKEDFIKKDIFIYQKENYQIYCCNNFSTAIWLDNSSNIIKIQQRPLYAILLKNKYDLYKYTSRDIHKFFELSPYEYRFSKFYEFPDGICVPLHIEFIKQNSNFDDNDPDIKKLTDKLDELTKQFPIESEEFSVKVNELDVQYICMTLQKGMKLELFTTIDIHPENLIVNQPLPQTLLQIDIPDGTIIHQGKEPNSPYYIYHKEKNKNSEATNDSHKSRNRLMIFLFVSSCIGISILSIYITKKFLGWGM